MSDRCYPCADCGTMRTKEEGGTVFTVCDACWDKHWGKKPPSDFEQMAREWLNRFAWRGGYPRNAANSLATLLQHVRDKTWNEATTKDIPAMLVAEYERGCDERDEHWRNDPMTKEHYESIVRERDEEWEKAVLEVCNTGNRRVCPDLPQNARAAHIEDEILRRMGRK